MNRQMHLRIDRPKLVHRLAKHIQHAAQRLAAHRHHDARAGIDRLHPANHALGRNHRDAAHAALAKVLLHLNDDVKRGGNDEAFADDPQRLKDRRHVRLFELNVNGRSADRNYFSNILCHRSLSLLQLSRTYRAAAPLTISIISFVIAACRHAVHRKAQASIKSPAFFVAASVAVIRAACSAAVDSSNA